jgi:hypothetical protein
MESLLLSYVTSFLRTYIKNIQPSQISLNLLSGKGELRNLDFNVDELNALVFASGAPALRFTRITCNTLAIRSPDVWSLSKKPIVFFVDRLYVEIAEGVDVAKKPRRPGAAGGISAPAAAPAAAATGTKYGFMDRVLDCLSLEVNQITVAFRTLGKIKSSAVGPWTPPVLVLELAGGRWFCTNHNGVEVELNECIRIRNGRRPLLFLYKRLEVARASVYVVNPETWSQVSDELIHGSGTLLHLLRSKPPPERTGRGYVAHRLVHDLPLQVGGCSCCLDSLARMSASLIVTPPHPLHLHPTQLEMCFRKRVDNNVLLGLELAFILGSVKVTVAEQYVAEIAHFVVGIHYCLFRRDAVEEIYGPDPHGEGYTAASAAAAAAAAAAAGAGAQKSATGPPTAAASAAAAVAAAAAAAATAAVPSSLRRDLLRREERESLDRIEAELANVAYADDDDRVDDWQVTRHATGTLPAPVVLVGLI